MKITAATADAFIKKPNPAARAVLLYGPDTGLVRERGSALTRLIAEDTEDPFRVVELAGSQLGSDPARLGDEAAAMSMIGGRRVVRITGAADGQVKIFDGFLADSPGDALVVVEAGDLGPRSSLRKLFEGAENAAAVPCYLDEGAALDRVIAETLTPRGLRLSRDARAYLAANLGDDRLVTRSELEKLALYMGGGGEVSLEEAQACVGDNAAFSLDAVAIAAASGDMAGVDAALVRALRDGLAPIQILRSVARYFHRLFFVAALVEKGAALETAVGKLRPPVFFKVKPQFTAQARKWRGDKLARALEILTEAELRCKRTGTPADAVCSRALLQIAAAGRGK